MAETQIGTVGVVWGIPGGLTMTGVLTAFQPQSLNFNRESDVAEVRNSRGATTTKIYYNKRRSISIEVVVTGSTLAAAKTNNVCPAVGTVVTIADTATPDDDTQLAELHSGKYICERSSKAMSATSEVRLSMDLVQYEDSDVAVVVAAS
jgi:polyferredoxin